MIANKNYLRQPQVVAIYLLVCIIIGKVNCSQCVNDAANFQEIYNILKAKSIQEISRKVNNNVETKLQILKDSTNPSSSSSPDIFQTSLVSKLFVPLQIIDISEELIKDPNYKVDDDDIENWEKKYGRMPIDSIVLIRTNIRDKQFNGWDTDFLEYLFKDRNITGIGYDQLKHEMPEEQKKFLIDKILLSQVDDLSKNNLNGNLIQIRKVSEGQEINEWYVEVITVIPDIVCSIPTRLMNQWGTILLILAILLGLIALIWYCCLKRFDKYNKEQFQLQNWESRNQEAIYHNHEELNIPLSDLDHKKE